MGMFSSGADHIGIKKDPYIPGEHNVKAILSVEDVVFSETQKSKIEQRIVGFQAVAVKKLGDGTLPMPMDLRHIHRYTPNDTKYPSEHGTWLCLMASIIGFDPSDLTAAAEFLGVDVSDLKLGTKAGRAVMEERLDEAVGKIVDAIKDGEGTAAAGTLFAVDSRSVMNKAGTGRYASPRFEMLPASAIQEGSEGKMITAKFAETLRSSGYEVSDDIVAPADESSDE